MKKAAEGTIIVDMTASIKMQNVILDNFKVRYLVQIGQKVKTKTGMSEIMAEIS